MPTIIVGVSPAHRLRQRCQSAAGASRGASSRNGGAAGDRREPGRIAGQLLTESVLLRNHGWRWPGLLFAFAGVRGLVGLIPLSGGCPSALDVTPDVRLFAFTLAVSFVTGILFGLAPALEAIRPDRGDDAARGDRLHQSPAPVVTCANRSSCCKLRYR